MQLDYLLFDSTDEEDGSCGFDALAFVAPARISGLAREVTAVLGWAHRSFGSPMPAEDGGEWDFNLEARGEDEVPLAISYDFAAHQLALPQASDGITVALTLSGSRAFADAFREAFADQD